jgi:predicted nucleotidyltransferase
MCDYSSYIEAYKKRIEKQKVKEAKLFEKLNVKAREAAKKLGKNFDLKRVYLFGSLNNKQKFYIDSDVDIAVEGLAPAEFLTAWGFLEDYLDYDFDLVQLEKANDSLKEIIIEEGEVIYESL